MARALIGVIGGSGLYEMQGLTEVQEVQLETPFGPTSDPIVCGKLQGIPVAFLSRHGRGHRLIPSEVPYKANIHGLRQLGVRYLLSLSAVGSLQEKVRPLDMMIPDQFIDMTRKRDSTFLVVARSPMSLWQTQSVPQWRIAWREPLNPPRLDKRCSYIGVALICALRARSSQRGRNPTGIAVWVHRSSV